MVKQDEQVTKAENDEVSIEISRLKQLIDLYYETDRKQYLARQNINGKHEFGRSLVGKFFIYSDDMCVRVSEYNALMDSITLEGVSLVGHPELRCREKNNAMSMPVEVFLEDSIETTVEEFRQHLSNDARKWVSKTNEARENLKKYRELRKEKLNV